MAKIGTSTINEANDNLQKANLLKEALKIVDKLATFNVREDRNEIEDLIDEAEKLKKHRLWKLT
jgi:hypothetical protein